MINSEFLFFQELCINVFPRVNAYVAVDLKS